MHAVRGVCLCSSLRWWHESGGRGFSSAAEDQEWRFLHAGPEEVKDTHCQRLAALAHTQVLDQRTLLQPQGTINRTHIRARALMYPVVDISPGAEGQRLPALVLSFTIACCGLISLMCHRVQGYTAFLHQFLLKTVCVLLLNRFQLQTEGFPFCFSCSKCPRIPAQIRQSQMLMKQSALCFVFSLWYIFCIVCFSCLQTSVFTPAYGSVTNVRVNSSMTTAQVLNLLLHKFRVSGKVTSQVVCQ